MHRIIKFNQKAWLKPYIVIKIDQREQKMLMNNAILEKTMESMRKHKSIKL